jgi:hypothetical protein
MFAAAISLSSCLSFGLFRLSFGHGLDDRKAGFYLMLL